MYIKRIVCNVPQRLKFKFSSAQEKWNSTISAKGFVAQSGGWNSLDDTEACIISFWESKDDLKYFMTNLHDQILNDNKQNKLYSSIVVDHYNTTLTLEGESSTIVEAIKNAKLLRIADCRVNKDSVEHFDQVQKNIWQSEMQKVNGILRGYFSKSTKDTNKYLIITFWESLENHKNYINNILHGLRERVEDLQAFETIAVKEIVLVDNWKIFKD